MPDTDTVTRQRWLDKLKQTRTTALRLFTLAENKLKALLSQHESVSFITHQQSELQTLFDNAREAHDDYMAEADFSSEEANLAEGWISSLRDRLAKMESDVTAFLISQSDDSEKPSGETKSAKESHALLKRQLTDLQQEMAAREAKMKEEWESLQAEGQLVAKRLQEKLQLVAPGEIIKEDESVAKLFATGTESKTPLRRSSGMPDLSKELFGDFEELLKPKTERQPTLMELFGPKKSSNLRVEDEIEILTDPPGFSPPRKRDSWIEDGSRPGRSTRPTIAARLPKISLEKFDGDSKNWPRFISNFKVLVHDVITDDSQRMAMLTELLTEKVRQVIAFAYGDPEKYYAALKTLKMKYGNPYIIARAHLTSLRALPTVPERNHEALVDFSASLSGAVGAIIASGYEHELVGSDRLADIVQKLPFYLQDQWAQFAYGISPRVPCILDFEKWVSRMASCAMLNMSSQVAPTTAPLKKNERKSEEKKKSGKPQAYTSLATQNGGAQPQDGGGGCAFCERKHSGVCFSLNKMSTDERIKAVKEKGCCFRCLQQGHLAINCSSKKKCGINGCTKLHHPDLHQSLPTPSATSAEKEKKPDTICSSVTTPDPSVLLAVIPVNIQFNGRQVNVLALLDPGSQVTLLKSDVAAKLGMKGVNRSLKVKTVQKNVAKMQATQVSFTILSADPAVEFTVECAYAVQDLSLMHKAVGLQRLKREWRHLAGVEFAPQKSTSIELLIGMDVTAAHEILELKKPAQGVDGPRAIRTPFGWCVIGKVPPPEGPKKLKPVNAVVGHVSIAPAEDDLHNLVQGFFSIESMGIKREVKPPMAIEHRKALEILDNTILHIGDRYQVGLMWKDPNVMLPNNKIAALRRFYSLERRFARDLDFASNYSAVIHEYLDLGHARKLRASELNGPIGKTWYLPHHGVVHPAKPGKPRVVFDCSAVHDGVSLNGVLQTGPDLLTSLIGCLLRFRQHRIGLSADIAKMYHQVRVQPVDQSVLRFLWREPGSTSPPETYQMLVHVFGAVSSPTTCIYALNRTAQDNQEEFPDLVQKVREFYVDNYLDSVDDEAAAISTQKRLTELCQRGGFPLVKWLSSSKEVLAATSPEERSHPTLNLDFEDLPTDRTLGLLWDCQTDSFVINVKVLSPTNTKRGILSQTASVFDPLGFLAPVIVKAKAILQEIWRSGVDWDDEVPAHLVAEWEKWTSSLASLGRLKIPRWFGTSDILHPPTLHVFADASEIGYGAVAYLVFTRKRGEAKVAFVMSKARVTPLTYQSIPRLELQAAVVGLRLAETITGFIHLDPRQTVFWTDSQTVLQWINSKTCRFTTFVANRIGEIHEGSDRQQWRHVPTELNPADDCSRGLDGSDLDLGCRWFQGPPFLRLSEPDWPLLASPGSCDDVEVISAAVCAFISAPKENEIEILIERHSTWNRLIRIVAWIRRWLPIRKGQPQGGKKSTWIDAAEFNEARTAILKVAQLTSFHEEISHLKKGKPIPGNSRLATLSPFIDKNGLLRVGGRLSNSDLDFGQRHPIVLDPTHRLAKTIIWNFHVRLRHGGVERTLADTRLDYFILTGRSAIRRELRNCFICRKSKAVPQVPLMAALPKDRVRACSRPFQHVGIDYFGPMEVTIHRRRHKRYGCLFTCLATRAVHLQVTDSLDQDSFLMAFDCFALRRGFPSTCYSDNGTNLVAGEREIRQSLEHWNQQLIGSTLAAKNIKWVFNPPAAPHFGGVWERMVQSAKRALRAILNGRTVTDKILETAMVEVENLINSRPLTHVSVHPTDPEPLTPNHFLIGAAHPNQVFASADDDEVPLKKKFAYVKMLADHFWKRWMKEYVPNLIERRKWLSEQRNIQEGDIVVIADGNNPRGEWPIGRITRPIVGTDGRVRAAMVKTPTGEYLRPVAKLCLLEAETPEPGPEFSGENGGNVMNHVMPDVA